MYTLVCAGPTWVGADIFYDGERTSVITIVAIDHIVLRTANVEPMIDFYVEVLGCAVERETAPKLGLTQLRAGSALIDLVRVDSELGAMGGGPPTPGENNMDHLCLQISPVGEQELITYLRNTGIEASGFEQRYGAQGLGRSLYIKDPDNNTVELTVKRQAN